MGSRTPMDWYEYQWSSDASARLKARELLGPELAAFADAMSAMVTCLEYAVEARYEDLAEKYKVGIAVYCFNLLCSAWDDAMTGRFGPARNQVRMITESHDFLVALVGRPGLAHELENGQVKVEAALRATRDALNEEKSGAGSTWFAERTSEKNPLHDFAHLTRFAIKSGWGTTRDDDKLNGFVRPGGVITKDTLRSTTIMLAVAANSFSKALVYAFPANEKIQAFWKSEGFVACESHLEELPKLDADLPSVMQPLDTLIVQSGWAREDRTQNEVMR